MTKLNEASSSGIANLPTQNEVQDWQKTEGKVKLTRPEFIRVALTFLGGAVGLKLPKLISGNSVETAIKSSESISHELRVIGAEARQARQKITDFAEHKHADNCECDREFPSQFGQIDQIKYLESMEIPSVEAIVAVINTFRNENPSFETDLQAVTSLFEELGLNDTDQRINDILYLARQASRYLAVPTDELHQQVEALRSRNDFWFHYTVGAMSGEHKQIELQKTGEIKTEGFDSTFDQICLRGVDSLLTQLTSDNAFPLIHKLRLDKSAATKYQPPEGTPEQPTAFNNPLLVSGGAYTYVDRKEIDYRFETPYTLKDFVFSQYALFERLFALRRHVDKLDLHEDFDSYETAMSDYVLQNINQGIRNIADYFMDATIHEELHIIDPTNFRWGGRHFTIPEQLRAVGVMLERIKNTLKNTPENADQIKEINTNLPEHETFIFPIQYSHYLKSDVESILKDIEDPQQLEKVKTALDINLRLIESIYQPVIPGFSVEKLRRSRDSGRKIIESKLTEYFQSSFLERLSRKQQVYE